MNVTPSSIPLRVVEGHAILCPESLERLFGSDYTLKGSERVTVEAGGREIARLRVQPGAPSAVVVDAVLMEQLGKAGSSAQLHGPKGARALPGVSRIPRRLLIPAALASAWKVSPDRFVRMEIGHTVFSDVKVADGKTPVLELSECDILVAGGKSGRLLGHAAAAETVPCKPCTDGDASGRLITENDIRKARMERRRVVLRPGQLITPSARSLAREFGILDDLSAM